MRLDKLDVGVLRLLQEDARLSFREIASKLGTTTPTVASRVRALEDLGVLRGYHADVDRGVLGGTLYIVTVWAPPSATRGLVETIRGLPGAEEVFVLAGGTVQARVRLRPPATLNEIQAALAREGHVAGYDAVEVLETPFKSAFQPVMEDIELVCHQCQGPIQGEPVRVRLEGRAHAFCCRQCSETFQARYDKLAGKGDASPKGEHGRKKPA